jgi:hypothetical protein
MGPASESQAPAPAREGGALAQRHPVSPTPPAGVPVGGEVIRPRPTQTEIALDPNPMLKNR